MKTTTEILPVSLGPHRLYVEAEAGEGTPVVLMHGLPDNTHLYDRLVPYLASRRPVVRFDFLGWGRSDKPAGYPYTAANQVGDVAAVAKAAREHFGASQLVLVAHDASGPPAIDWALANSGQVEALVLLNTYYHWTPALRRPPAITLYSTPLIRNAARAMVVRRPDLDRRLYAWQVSKFIQDPAARAQLVPELYEQFPQMRRFQPPVRVIFGASDRYLNPRVAARFAALFPNAEMHLLSGAGHYVQVDQPQRVAELMFG
jgi:pimeloyl-ACP methyl ester carboxylesterase